MANEAAGFGRAAGLIPAARSALDAVGQTTLLLTQARGDETRCTQQALAHGATSIAVLGGDGTISQVACELVRQQSSVPLAILGAGTGNDFAKSLGAPTRDFRAMAALIAAGHSRVVDAGRIDGSIFLNSGGFGFDAAVVASTQRAGRWRGKSVYTATALRELFRYPGFSARISHAGAPSGLATGAGGTHTTDGHWLTMVFANGAWFGGSYRIAPDASIADGFLDAVLISNAPAWRRALLFGRAVGAWHLGEREVVVQRNTRWTIDFPDVPVYQADGELRQAAGRSVVVEIVPAALRFAAPASPSPQPSQY